MPVVRPPITRVNTGMFTVGRCAPGGIRAIVLHEYDGSLEQLAAEMASCNFNQPGCHRSFHYGVGVDSIHQYVLDANTAWTFDCSTPCEPCESPCPPCWETDDCECCVPEDWPLRVTYPTQDPNCYTINIAVATGVINVGTNCGWGNNWTWEQLRQLGNLIAYLIDQHGILTATTDVFTLCSELADLPREELDDIVDEILTATPTGRLSGLLDCNGDPVPLGTMIYTCDGEPGGGALSPCDTLQQMVVTTANTVPDESLIPIYRPGDDTCRGLLIPEDCTAVVAVTTQVLGRSIDGSTLGWYRPLRYMPIQVKTGTGQTATPSGVIYHTITEDDSTLSILAPEACESNEVYIKVKGTAGLDLIVSSPDGNIDGATSITLTTGTDPFGGLYGESVHLYWTGTEWLIL